MQNSQTAMNKDINWVSGVLPDIAEIIMGQSPPSSSYNHNEDGLPFFQGNKDFGDRYPTITIFTNRPNKISEKGDILVSVRAPIGDVNLSIGKCCIGRGLAALRPKNNFDSLLLFYYIKHVQHKLETAGTGSTFKGISKTNLAELEINFPDETDYQKRLSSSIDRLVNLGKDANRSIHRSVQLIRQFRQSIFLAAVSGRLTEDWRRKNVIENTIPKKFRAVNFQESEIEGWVKTNLENIYTSFGGGTPSRGNSDFWNGDIPWVSSGDVKSDYIENGSETITEKGLKQSTSKLCKTGSVITVVRSGILKHTFPVALVKSPFAINQDIKCFDSDDSELNYWLFLFLKGNEKKILSLNREGTTVQSVKYETLKSLEIDLPPYEEQKEIAKRTKAMLDFAQKVEKQIEATSKNNEKLTQAILAKAFRGEL